MSPLLSFFFFLIFHYTIKSVNSNYEYICEEKLAFKPYLKIYDRRLGELIQDFPPGLYDVSAMKNIYVCTNGPVWLYFAHYTATGSVYDESNYTMDSHKCVYYNGDPGPSAIKEQRHLVAILLLGNETDFRSPSIKLFTAPYTDEQNSTGMNVTINATSFMTIGSFQCSIFKGADRTELRLYVDPTFNEEAVCKFAYQDIDQWFSKQEDRDRVRKLLTMEVNLQEGPCIVTPVPVTKNILDGFSERKFLFDKMKADFEKEFATAPVDKSADITTKQGEIDTIEALARTNPAEYAKKKPDLDVAKGALYGLQLEQVAYTTYKEAKNMADSSSFDVTTWSAKPDDFPKLMSDRDGFQQKIRVLRYNFSKLRGERDADLAKKYRAEYAIVNPQLQDVTKKISTTFEETKVNLMSTEVLIEKMKGAVASAKKAKEEVDKYTKDKTYQSPYLKELQRNLLPDVITIPHDDNKLFEKNCAAVPFVGDVGYRIDKDDKGTCFNGKGSKLKGCQLVKAALGDPSVCQYHEEDEMNSEDLPEPKAGKTVHPVSHFIPEYLEKIFTLMEDIYPGACTRVERSITLVKRVNNVMRCYLIKDYLTKNGNYDPAIPVPPRTTTKNREKFWDKIVGALEVCKSRNPKLEFVKESRTSKRYLLTMDYKYMDIPALWEQADNEYGFNFAIEMNWRIFATILGLCMPSYESKVPLITTRFFTMYTEDVLIPLHDTWISLKDNNVYKRILSSHYGAGGSDAWSLRCMEASYVHSTDTTYRPPRKILVNGRTEWNYFVKKLNIPDNRMYV